MKNFIIKNTSYDNFDKKLIPSRQNLILTFKEIKDLAKKIQNGESQTQKLNSISQKIGYSNFQHLRAEYISDCFDELGTEISRIKGETLGISDDRRITNVLELPYRKYVTSIPLGDATFIHDEIEMVMETNNTDISILKFYSKFGDAELKISKKRDRTFLKINFFDAIIIKENEANGTLAHLLQMFSIFVRTLEYDNFNLLMDDIREQIEIQSFTGFSKNV